MPTVAMPRRLPERCLLAFQRAEWKTGFQVSRQTAGVAQQARLVLDYGEMGNI